MQKIVPASWRLALTALVAVPGVTCADWGDYDYQEQRQLELDADGIAMLSIDAGAGSLDVRGSDSSRQISVDAVVLVKGARGEEAERFIAKRLRLELDRRGDEAVLIADFPDGWMGDTQGAVALEVTLPQGIDLVVDDGSGSIEIEDTRANVRVDDGSGSLSVRNAGDVLVDDGSGSLNIEGATGNVKVTDGSGSLKIRGVTGDVWIDDGSGSISVYDVAGNLTIVDAGSGGTSYEQVAGTVSVSD